MRQCLVVACRICEHEHRFAIERALGAKSADHFAIAKAFGVTVATLERHFRSHPRAPAPKPAKVTRPKRARTERAPSPAPEPDEQPATSRSPSSTPTARAELDELVRTIRELLDAATLDEEATYGDRAALIRTALTAIKLHGQLTGEFGASESTIVASPYFKRMLDAILESLRNHPVARKAVIDALEREQRGGDRAEDVAA